MNRPGTPQAKTNPLRVSPSRSGPDCCPCDCRILSKSCILDDNRAESCSEEYASCESVGVGSYDCRDPSSKCFGQKHDDYDFGDEDNDDITAAIGEERGSGSFEAEGRTPLIRWGDEFGRDVWQFGSRGSWTPSVGPVSEARLAKAYEKFMVCSRGFRSERTHARAHVVGAFSSLLRSF